MLSVFENFKKAVKTCRRKVACVQYVMLHHRRATRLLNAIIVFSLVGLLLVHLNQSYTTVDDATTWSESQLSQVVSPSQSSKGYQNKESQKNLQNVQVSSSIEKEVSGEYNVINGWNLKDLVAQMNVSGREVVDTVNFLNDNFVIQNTDKFGPVKETKTIIVIQVHNRFEYLRILIDTLGRAKGIGDCLLVFSHDINIPQINDLIGSITFARVLQIFYPFNLQLFPHVFPGQDENDCPEKIKKNLAESSGCRNWKHPDKYGHYRVAKFTQIKHHWWWKMNYVFDGVVSRYGLQESWVLLLEEDHYVSPDFLHVLDQLIENKKNLCPDCAILSLGFYLSNYNLYGINIDRLGIYPWYSSKHNMGMALRFDTWQDIKNCSKLFCEWDDYNWDWSLLQISVKCLKQRWRVIFTKSPRIIHVGDCGVHTHRCQVNNASATAATLFEKHKKKLFPAKMQVTEVSKRMLKPPKENGGWGDVRDRRLCLRNTYPLEENEEDDEVLKELYQRTIRFT